jgi:hypothetical protein
MLKLNVLRDDGTRVPLQLPETYTEWPLRLYIDALIEIEALNQLLSDASDDPLIELEILRQQAKIVAAFLGKEFEELMEYSVISDAHQDLSNLFNYITSYCAGVKPNIHGTGMEKYSFEFRNKQFRMHANDVDSLNRTSYSDMSLGQLVNIMEIKRKLFDHASGKETFKDVDPDGSRRYTLFLSILAALSVEVGYEFPSTPERFDRHLEKNIVFFQDIDIQTAINADFFLTVTLRILGMTQATSTFGNHQLTMHHVMQMRQNGTANKKKPSGGSSKEQVITP